MVHYKLAEKILKLLNKGEIYSQKEISLKLGDINRAILTGYLRCMADLGQIESQDKGRAKIYLKRRVNKK